MDKKPIKIMDTIFRDASQSKIATRMRLEDILPIGKVSVFIYLFMWVRFTLPRYRYDQLMKIGWKILIPISLVNILVTGFMRIWV